MADTTNTTLKTPNKKSKGKIAAFILGLVAAVLIAVALYLHYDSIVVTAAVGAALLVVLIFALFFRIPDAAHVALGLFSLIYAVYHFYSEAFDGGLDVSQLTDYITTTAGYEDIMGIVAGLLYIISGIMLLVILSKKKKAAKAAKTAPLSSSSTAIVPVTGGVPANGQTHPVLVYDQNGNLVQAQPMPAQPTLGTQPMAANAQPVQGQAQQVQNVPKGKEVQLKIGDGSDGAPIFITIKRD